MPRTRLRTVLLLPVAGAALLLFNACGDGPDVDPTPPASATAADGSTAAPGASTTGSTPAPGTATATGPTRAAGDFGPAPFLEGYVLKVSPEYASTVTQASTRSPIPDRPRGVCAEVSFEGLNENVLWFRLAVNGVEVTQQLTWLVASAENPTGGTMCYAPTEGLPVGRVQAAVVVQNPNNANENTRQVAQWEFDVQ